MKTRVFSLGMVCLAAACGGPDQPKTPEQEVKTDSPAEKKLDGPKPQISAELGEIDAAATTKTFEAIKGKLNDCHKEGLAKRAEYEDGDVKFFMRVGADGKTRYAYLEDSTLGDRDTEKCMLGVLAATQWPKPKGGEAEVRRTEPFEAPNVRPPTDWSSDKIAPALAKGSDAAQKCKHGAKGEVRVTMYVAPSEDKKDGKVVAAGAAVTAKELADGVDCVVDAVKGWKLPTPGSYPAKVSFIL